MHKKRSRFLPSPVRVRQEPPTVAEAVAAAQALTPVLEQQVDITAGLMGLSPDETRPFVLEAPPPTLQRSAAPQLLPTPSLARVFGVKSAGYANIEPLPRRK